MSKKKTLSAAHDSAIGDMNTEGESKCPFTGGMPKYSAGGGTSNRDWWPNLLRLNIAAAAKIAKVAPDRMSFVNCLRAFRRGIERPAPGTPIRAVAASRRLLREMSLCLIDRPRRARLAPRAVRKPFKPYRGKGVHDRTRKVPLKSWRPLARVG